MQAEERSLHLLLWAAAERQQALATEIGKRAHPANTGVLRARSTILASRAVPSPASLASQDRPVTVDGELRLSCVRSGHEATVTVEGEVDCATAPRLADALRELLTDPACRVTVDLAAMTFIDSTGLATLVSALRAAREGGGDVVLHAPRRCVRKVLEISGADQLFVVT